MYTLNVQEGRILPDQTIPGGLNQGNAPQPLSQGEAVVIEGLDQLPKKLFKR